MEKTALLGQQIRTKPKGARGWLTPFGLIVLSLIPFAAGIARLVGLAGAVSVTPENARFFAAPIPVVLHIIGASLFCVLGAFQFVPSLRKPKKGWHRVVGRVLLPSGIVAALTGIWMTVSYPLAALQGSLLYGFRILIGTSMALFLVLGWLAIARRDLSRHRAWTIRGYAIGQGAGTQALMGIPFFVLWGEPDPVLRDLLLIAGWLINLGVAEWFIRKAPKKPHQGPVGLPLNETG